MRDAVESLIRTAAKILFLENLKNFSTLQTSGKEPISRQLLKFLERNLAKNVPNSLITLAGMSSDFETLFVFNLLITEATLSV